MKRAVLLNLLWVLLLALPWWARAENFTATDYLRQTSTLYNPEPPPQNEDLLDTPVYYVPLEIYQHKCLDQGRMPFWNPLYYAGAPCFSNGASGYFYPPRILLMKLVPVDVAWHLSLFVHLFLSALAAYALGRQRGLGRNPALLLGTAWMLNGPCLTWLEMDFLAILNFWLPFCLWAVYKAAHSWRWTGISALGLLCLLTCGHLQWVFYACLVILADSLWRLRGLPRACWAKTVCAALLGVTLATPMLFPTAVHMAASAREDRPPEFLQSSYRQMLKTLPLTVSFPDAWGSPVNGFEFRRVFGYGNFIYPELCIFSGNVVVMLALLALLGSPRCRRGFAVGLLLFAIPATPLYPPLAEAIPGIAKIVPTRMGYLVCLAIAGLGGVGLQLWETGRVSLRQRRVTAMVALCLMGAGILWVAWMQSRATLLATWIEGGLIRLPDRERYLAAGDFLRAVSEGFQRTYSCWGPSFLPHLVTLALFALLVVQSGGWARHAVVILAGAELLFFGARFNPVVSGPFYPDNPIAREMAQRAGSDRCMGLFTVKPNQMSPFGVSLVEGYDPFFPRPMALLEAHLAGIPPQASTLSSYPGLALERAQSPWLDLLDVGYVLGLSPKMPGDKWELIPGAAAPLQLFRNKRCLGRVRVVGQAICEPDLRRAVDEIESGQIDSRTTTIVHIPSQLPALGGQGQADLESYQPEEVAIKAAITGTAIVVLADSYAPGWTVTVDGQERPLLQCDVALRGVVVEEGTHRVVFRYRPPGFDKGCVLAILALLTIGGLLLTRPQPWTSEMAGG